MRQFVSLLEENFHLITSETTSRALCLVTCYTSNWLSLLYQPLQLKKPTRKEKQTNATGPQKAREP